MKKIVKTIKLQVPAGKASPSPPIGPALGQAGLNIMDFCKAFNEKTQDMEPNTPIPVAIMAFEDRTFAFETRTPPASYLLKKAAGLAKGSSEPNKNKVGQVSLDQIREIAQVKFEDMNAVDIESAMESIKGSARSMGITVA